ncbi:MAG TPA: adenylate/guanylate cyclase domain-containing protein [Candidatus Sulfomarinibacteraceae bacterium]|nr:adenylate/guanylate cyclase domain-containing protein [Candidatus Sulfomarinibacteraceae bacterium]
MIEKRTPIDYLEPAANGYPTKRLVEVGGGSMGFPFYERIEIGRQRSGAARPGLLLVSDPTVSSRHCVVVQEPDGRCFVRDTSRNGTRLDGRRLSPNSKTPIAVGQVLSLGRGLELRLEGNAADRPTPGEATGSQTVGIADATLVTILVGDIRGFTLLVQRAPPEVLQASVARVFGRLEREVVAFGGTLKEFQGDALFAFWERGSTPDHAADACRAALALDRLARRLAGDPETWSVDGFPLAMDWALTTGPVSISGYGGDNVLGLSMVGEAVVLAFRLEKLAGDDTGSIVVCPATRMLADRAFRFRDLGLRTAKGFDEPQRVWALLGER